MHAARTGVAGVAPLAGIGGGAGIGHRAGRRTTRARIATALLTALVSAGSLTGCSSGDAGPGTTGSSSGSTAAAAQGGSAAPVPDAAITAIRAAVATVNAAAGTSPDQQRSALTEVVDPARAAEMSSCRASRTTVKFEPVWSQLRAAPSGAPGEYVLPTLIEIYTGARMTGTDVTALTLRVSGTAAYLPPLCID